MNTDNKKLLKYLGFIFIAILLAYKLPYDSYSIIQYIIRPIVYKGGALTLSGIIPLILFILGTKGLFSLERFANVNKLLLFIVILAVVIPVMRWTLDTTRISYHRIRGDKLKAVDLVDAHTILGGTETEVTIDIYLELIDYSRGRNEFKIRLHLPKDLSDYTGKEVYDLDKKYTTFGNKTKSAIREKIILKLNDEELRKRIADSQWYWKDFKYESCA